MKIFQPKNGFRYNSDSLILFNFAKEYKLKGRVLEIGGGCGVISLLLKKKFPNLVLTSIDIQKSACEIMKKNSSENKLEFEVINEDFSQFKTMQRFDFIISNPPFYRQNTQQSLNESFKISRYCNYLPLEILIKNSSSHLKANGSLVFCYDATDCARVISILTLNKFALTHIQFVHYKKEQDAKLILVVAKKSSKALNKILPPIILQDEFGQRTSMAKEIYNLDLESIDYDI